MTKGLIARAAATGIGIAMLVAAGTGWLNVADPAAPAGFAAAPAGAPVVGTSRIQQEPVTAAGPGSPVEGGPARGPVREVWLPERDVRIPVVAVGVTENGTMRVPEDVRVAGWYRFGPKPGDPHGSVVISGHINDRDQGPGAFRVLTEVTEAEPVVVTMADGGAVRYRISARKLVDKGAAPMPNLFRRDGAPRLTLITCGGPLDRATHNYRDNIVVTAVPRS